MSKKIIKKKKIIVDLKKLSFSDLYAMYSFTGALNNLTFGKKVNAKKIINDKFAELEAELFARTFGLDPFKLEKNEPLKSIVGQDPIKVIDSFGKTELENKFVVVKNK